MLAITHLAVSVLLIYLLTLDRNDRFVALMFGVFIDVDHLFGLKAYVSANGIAGVLDFDSLMQADGQWKSMLHSPVAVMVVGPVATASRLALPLLFWGVHITMDYAEDAFLGLFSAWEMMLLAGSVSALVVLSYRKARTAEPSLRFSRFLALECSWLVSPVARIMRAIGRPHDQ